MTRHFRIVALCILIGFLLYCFILLQTFLIPSFLPGEPVSQEFRKVCSSSQGRKNSLGRIETEGEEGLPIIYVATPTYTRPEMGAELTRLGQTLLLVPRIHWIVVEDSHECSKVIASFLKRLGLPYTHIVSPMPDPYRRQYHPAKGVSNRRAAIHWVIHYGDRDGVLYFLDDDNSIDVRLFEEMRDTQKVSMWPVGLIGKYIVSSPILNEDDGAVSGFFDDFSAGRKFAVDMAGFAVNVGFLKSKKNVTMPYIAGYEEDGFLRSLNIELEDIEPKANGCSEILVWHTRTEEKVQLLPSLSRYFQESTQSTNIRDLFRYMKSWGLVQ